MFAVSQEHLRYAEEVLEDVPRRNLIVEPQDDGTTFAILYSLLRLAKRDPQAVVAFFSADLQIADAQSFMRRVEAAAEFNFGGKRAGSPGRSRYLDRTGAVFADRRKLRDLARSRFA